ncbi:zinc finger MYM-type protein 1-like [Sipha flava]|uniref:Zinc finger MYM-type protein 1-like n=1 Tax=Sipha flava TaxID=143950 RepID=A0A8B8G4X5_9HEMI|nr:zinc finger MYM-type protein 1-like [Sipha flava]
MKSFELALRGYDEKLNSENPGVFRGLINFSSELDSVLKCHIENSSVFKGLSKSIQNDLLECCLAVCQQRIKNEIKQAEYISVIADETTDVSAQFQLSIIFRYLLSDGTPVERFWGFFNPIGHDAKSLSECIIFNLEKVLESPDMLICQSYDGANVMSGRLKGVQKIINNSYKNAHFIHCYAHQLNLILIQATSQNQSLIECMKEIESTFNQTIAINQARALHRMLIDDRFIFWLRVFHSLMPHVDILYN